MNMTYKKKSQIKIAVIVLLIIANIGAIFFASMRIAPLLSQGLPAKGSPAFSSEGRIAELSQALRDAGFEFTESHVQYSAINAADGRKFHFGYGVMEVYQFDKNGETYQSIMVDGEASFTGPDGSLVTWNDDLAMYMAGVEEEDAIREIFENLP